MGPRQDATFIRYLARTESEDHARHVQALPFISIGREIMGDAIEPALLHAIEPIRQHNLASFMEGDYRRLSVYAFAHLPWPEFLLHFNLPTATSHAVGSDHYIIVHVAPRETCDAQKVLNHYRYRLLKGGQDDTQRDANAKMDVIPIRINIFSPRGIYASAWVVCEVDTGKVFVSKYNVHKELAILSFVEQIAVFTLNYLALCPERVVESRPTSRPNRQMRRLAEQDFSQRTDLTTHILLDPTRAPAYQPESVRAIVAASGAKVKPHGRRSHWRRLPDKTVRVRATWIGPKDWEYQGRSYRVVKTHANSDADAEIDHVDGVDMFEKRVDLSG